MKKEKHSFKHELGKTAKDKITGFTGLLTARCEFLTGCNRYCIQPVDLMNGRPIDGIYFDEAQIEILGDGITSNEVQGEEKGACSHDPIK